MVPKMLSVKHHELNIRPDEIKWTPPYVLAVA